MFLKWCVFEADRPVASVTPKDVTTYYLILFKLRSLSDICFSKRYLQKSNIKTTDITNLRIITHYLMYVMYAIV